MRERVEAAFQGHWERRRVKFAITHPQILAGLEAVARSAFLAGVKFGEGNAPLSGSIQEALNSGDGTYRP